MILGGALGLFAGVLTALMWWFLQSLMSDSVLHFWVEHHLYIFSLLAMGLAGMSFFRKESFAQKFPQGLLDLVEEFYIGVQKSSALLWFLRGLSSFLFSFISGIVGIEGAIIETLTGLMSVLSSKFPKIFRRDIENRQVIVDSVMAGTLSVVLGAPFTAGLFVLENLVATQIRVRIAVFSSVLASYGTWKILSAKLNIEHFGIISTLFVGFKPMSLEVGPWLLLTLVSFVLGGLITLSIIYMGRFMGWMSVYLEKHKFYSWKGFFFFSSIVSFLVYLTPEAFIEPWRIWQEMTWAHLVTDSALLYLLARMLAFVFVSVGFGTNGLVSPLLFFGALLGYAVGNWASLNWALPLAMAGASAALIGGFTAPLAAFSLVLEVTHDSHLWWFSAIAVLGGILFKKILREESLFDQILKKQNITIEEGHYLDVLAEFQMRDAIVRDFAFISESSSLSELEKEAVESVYNVLVVNSEHGEFLGLLSLDQLPNYANLKGVHARDLMDRNFFTVKTTDPLSNAFKLLKETPALVVLDSQGKVAGLVFKAHVTLRYEREVSKRALNMSLG